jgi:hypothetical protein
LSTTTRFYFDIEGPDDQALKEGFSWLFAQALGSRGVVAVPGLQQVKNLVPGLSAGEAARLMKDKRLQQLGATIELVTERSGRPVAGAPVLGVWVDDEQLEKLERARPKAVCVIPWLRLRDDIRRWRAAYTPTEMRSGASAPKSAIANPVVARALGDLTVRVNLSTGL